MEGDLRARFVTLDDGVRLHVVEAGPVDGPPVLLLHGFPEYWWSWRGQLGPLAAAGWRVVMPDLRGYHLSDAPRGAHRYGLDRLAEDVACLLRELGPEPSPVVGHDWGGVAAWWAAVRFPRLISRLVILDAPHPSVGWRYVLHDRAQRRRSSYIYYFQLPFFPERRLARDRAGALRRMFVRTSRPGTFSPAELDRYATAILVPGRLSGMLAWYRAALVAPARRRPTVRVSVPTRLLWGARDTALGTEMIGPTLELCDQASGRLFPEAGHWLHHEEPTAVAAELAQFLD